MSQNEECSPDSEFTATLATLFGVKPDEVRFASNIVISSKSPACANVHLGYTVPGGSPSPANPGYFVPFTGQSGYGSSQNVWTKAYNISNHKTAFFVNLKGTQKGQNLPFWNYDNGVIKMAIVGSSQLAKTHIFDVISHSGVYWTITANESGSPYYVVFNPCNVPKNLPLSPNTSEFTEFRFTHVPSSIQQPGYSSCCRVL